MEGSEAARVRQEGVSVERRVLEYMELSSFGDILTGTIMTDEQCAVPRQGPRMTTNPTYWGIRDSRDWNQCADKEMAWLMGHPEEVRPLLGVMRDRGWSATADAVEMGLTLMTTRPVAIDFGNPRVGPPLDSSGLGPLLGGPDSAVLGGSAFSFASTSSPMWSGEGSAFAFGTVPALDVPLGLAGDEIVPAGGGSSALNGSGSAALAGGDATPSGAAELSPTLDRPISFLEASRRGAVEPKGRPVAPPPAPSPAPAPAPAPAPDAPPPVAAGGEGTSNGQRGRRGRRLRPGDWICPNPECGDHQFARNDRCRVCNTPRPAVEEEEEADASPLPPGLPPQPLTAAAVVAKAVAEGGDAGAKKRGGAAPKRAAPARPAPGKKEARSPRPSGGAAAAGVPAPAPAPAPAVPGKGHGLKFKLLPGDWVCSSCGDHQFARNATCRMCKAPRPPTETPEDAAGGGWERAGGGGDKGATPANGHSKPPAAAVAPGGGDAGGRTGSRRRKNKKKAALKAQDMLPGDWSCPKCGDHQFARNTTCRMCGTKAPVVASKD